MAFDPSQLKFPSAIPGDHIGPMVREQRDAYLARREQSLHPDGEFIASLREPLPAPWGPARKVG